ncbi:hypothetical protein CLOM_g16910 [Closterium sp. NIES-68]|nr:hypothetical protein CLOM_g16910 [Closterium sp. NIES-68]GJP81466.1 hypothetical protein CLOP_g11610 [Closterium sp. NIES-67]
MAAAAPAFPARDLFVAGKWTAPCKAGRLPVVNPATEETIGTIPAATAEDVDVAVQAARGAFRRNGGGDWPKTTGSYRAQFLKAIAAQVVERKGELARMEAMDCGKPLDEAAWDMDDVAGCFEYYAGLAEQLDAEQGAPLQVPMEQFACRIRKEPIGVVGLITPWNYPMLMAAWKVAPALAAGCTVVLKPSELASLTCLELGAIAAAVQLPAGVLNVVTGLGEHAGAALTAHKGLDKIAFTGSSATGKLVLRAASENLVPVTVELGGKSALLVFDDVDIDKAVEWAMFGCFWTNGQICSATSRLLLHERIAPAFLARLAQWSQEIRISDPLEPACRLGPLVSQAQYDKVVAFIEGAKAEGAEVLCGGKRPQHLARGYYLEPTVLRVTPGMRVWQEEVFGPVLAVHTFSDEQEAISLANDTSYGLAAAVISGDQERCRRVSEAMECGIVWVNCSQPCFCQAPWGGKKRSGFGRELGKWGLDNYLSVKQVTQYVSSDPWNWYPAPSKL